MKPVLVALSLAVAVSASGCAGSNGVKDFFRGFGERSRNLGDPSVKTEVLVSQVCSNCHGFDGNPVSPNFPRLAGQQKEYLVKQLKNFQPIVAADGKTPQDSFWFRFGNSVGLNSYHRSAGAARADDGARDYMWGIAGAPADYQVFGAINGLTDSQVQGLAEYFNGQPVSPPARLRGADVQRAAVGEQIFKNGVDADGIMACAICHGPDAKGKQPEFPRLASQNQHYIVKELKEFSVSPQKTPENAKALKWKGGRPGTPMSGDEGIAHHLKPEQMRDVAVYLQSLD
jgi:cytochrome c553